MRQPRALLAWSLWVLAFLLIAPLVIAEYVDSGALPIVSVSAAIGFLAWATIGAIVATRQPQNPIGWLLLAGGLFGSANGFGEVSAVYAARSGTLTLGRTVLALAGSAFVLQLISFILLLLLFPSGRLPSRRWRPGMWLVLAAVVLNVLYVTRLAMEVVDIEQFVANNWKLGYLGLEPSGFLRFLDTLSNVLLVPVFALGALALLMRLRSARGEERQQVKWVVYAGLVAFVMLIVFFLPGSPTQLQLVAGGVLLAVLAAGFGVAIFRYRLYDIDVIISKTLVYGALAVFIGAVYVAIVVGIGAAIGTQGEPNTALVIVATVVVAVAFQPIHQRLQHFANRLVFGERATPYEVMADFARRLGGALQATEALPRTAEAAARGVGAKAARARVFLPEGRDRSAVWPLGEDPGQFDAVVPVIHHEVAVGDLAVVKPRGESLRTDETELLEALAAQAGVVLRNVELTVDLEIRLEQISTQAEELRASRHRLVVARDTERRRLERQIRERIGSALAAIRHKLGETQEYLRTDRPHAVEFLDELRAEVQGCLNELRDLARGVFPPLLADRGLTEALAADLRKIAIEAHLEAGPDIAERRFSEGVEAAVYFFCREALDNVVRHANASSVTVSLWRQDGTLGFSVADDGSGFDPDHSTWSDLRLVADRLAAVGGEFSVVSGPGAGTTVSGRLPVDVEEPAAAW
jgi:signal transduction histidine kinase